MKQFAFSLPTNNEKNSKNFKLPYRGASLFGKLTVRQTKLEKFEFAISKIWFEELIFRRLLFCKSWLLEEIYWKKFASPIFFIFNVKFLLTIFENYRVCRKWNRSLRYFRYRSLLYTRKNLFPSAVFEKKYLKSFKKCLLHAKMTCKNTNQN